jgi:hypothetical protein
MKSTPQCGYTLQINLFTDPLVTSLTVQSNKYENLCVSDIIEILELTVSYMIMAFSSGLI